ncbi:hypothetical protein KC330_g196 [Hortaea werneckii]|nr:hypothetical protein KC330_g196 [Hortaea werneckii]
MLLLWSLLLLLSQAAFTMAGPFPRYVNSTFATAKTLTLMTAPGSATHANFVSSPAPLTISSRPIAHASASSESISDIRAWELNADLLPTIDATGSHSQSFTSTQHRWHFTHDPMLTQTSSYQLAANATALSHESSSSSATSSTSLDSITSMKEPSASYQHTTFRFGPGKTNATVFSLSSLSTSGMLRTQTDTRPETCTPSYFATSPSVSARESGITSASGPTVYGSLTLTYHVNSNSAMGPIVVSSFPTTSAGQTSATSSTTVQQLAPWTQSSYSVPADSDEKTQTQASWHFSYIPTMTTTTATSSHISHKSLLNHQQSSTEASTHSQVKSTSRPAAAPHSRYTTHPSHDLPEIVTVPRSSISTSCTSSTSSPSAKAGIVIVPVDPHAVTVTVTTTTTEKEFGATTTLRA